MYCWGHDCVQMQPELKRSFWPADSSPDLPLTRSWLAGTKPSYHVRFGYSATSVILIGGQGNLYWCALLDFGRLQRQNPKMAHADSERVDRLESHLAHLEHQVEQLNGVVIEQGKLLDRLSKETQRQSSAMQRLELERMKSNVRKPPHYQ
jgi:SlyX protein